MAVEQRDMRTAFVEYLEGQDEAGEGELNIATPKLVETALARLQVIEQDQAARAEFAAERIQEVKDWLEAERLKGENKAKRLREGLEYYMRTLNSMDPDIKTVKLPGGSLQLRTPQPKVFYPEKDTPEEAALREYGAAHDILRTTVDAKGAGANALLKAVALIAGEVNGITTEVDKPGLKKLIEAGPDGNAVDKVTKEPIPGVTIEPQLAAFSIAFPAPKRAKRTAEE
jgi:hypothetical protein